MEQRRQMGRRIRRKSELPELSLTLQNAIISRQFFEKVWYHTGRADAIGRNHDVICNIEVAVPLSCIKNAS